MRDKNTVKTVFVKPVAGVLVRDPHTFAPMPESGAEVVLKGRHGKYWRRRIHDGSLTVTGATKKEKPVDLGMKTKSDKKEDKE